MDDLLLLQSSRQWIYELAQTHGDALFLKYLVQRMSELNLKVKVSGGNLSSQTGVLPFPVFLEHLKRLYLAARASKDVDTLVVIKCKMFYIFTYFLEFCNERSKKPCIRSFLSQKFTMLFICP